MDKWKKSLKEWGKKQRTNERTVSKRWSLKSERKREAEEQ